MKTQRFHLSIPLALFLLTTGLLRKHFWILWKWILLSITRHLCPTLNARRPLAFILLWPTLTTYRAPTTIPSTESTMNRGQKYEDHSLKQLQYLLSAAFCPPDILIHEIFTHGNGNPNLERCSTMLHDIRCPLLHVCSTMTQQGNNLSLRIVNRSLCLGKKN